MRYTREHMPVEPKGKLTPEHKALIRLLAERAVDDWIALNEARKRATRNLQERLAAYAKEPPEPD